MERPEDNVDAVKLMCRRGMLELDLILTAFVEQHYAGLCTADRETFHALMQAADPVLHAWLMGVETPPDPAQQALIARIAQIPLK